MPEREQGGLPGRQPDRGGRGAVLHREADRRRQEQPAGAAAGDKPAGAENKIGRTSPYSGRGA